MAAPEVEGAGAAVASPLAAAAAVAEALRNFLRLELIGIRFPLSTSYSRTRGRPELLVPSQDGSP